MSYGNRATTDAMEVLSEHMIDRIFSYIDVHDLLRAAACCHAFRDVANDDKSWQTRALALWPSPTVQLSPATKYASYKELVLDNNREGCTTVLTYHGHASTWKHNNCFMYYECKLLHLEWDPLVDRISLYFDARGEEDLRDPLTSTLVFTKPIRPGQLLSSRFMLFAVHPASVEYIVDSERHKKGVLHFPGLQQLETSMARAMCLDNQSTPLPSLESYFVYGNTPPFAHVADDGALFTRCVWGSHLLDYEPCLALHVPASAHPPAVPVGGWRNLYYTRGIAARLHSKGSAAARGALRSAMERETWEDEHKRWADLPREHADRAAWGMWG